MITALVLSSAMPCLAPKLRKHRAKLPEPQQTCVIPMCFRDDPEIEPLAVPSVYVQYLEGADGEDTVSYLPIDGAGWFTFPAYGYTTVTSSTYKVPEINISDGLEAVVLLSGALLILDARRPR
jgi:hypothetical protein